MWMNSRFAQWEVEGEVRQRVSTALHEWEHDRLARTAQRAEAVHPASSVLNAVHAGLEWLTGRAAVGFQEVRSWVERTPRSQSESY